MCVRVCTEEKGLPQLKKKKKSETKKGSSDDDGKEAGGGDGNDDGHGPKKKATKRQREPSNSETKGAKKAESSLSKKKTPHRNDDNGDSGVARVINYSKVFDDEALEHKKRLIIEYEKDKGECAETKAAKSASITTIMFMTVQSCLLQFVNEWYCSVYTM